jgi:hypothetical protein
VGDQRFAFRFSTPYRIAGLPFGVVPSRCEVVVGDSGLLARFGVWHANTPLDNIVEVSITGPYAFPKTAGPAHLSLSDRGLTFATNGNRGVCVVLRDRITGIDPFGVIRHPNLTVTVEDCDGLAAALRASAG